MNLPGILPAAMYDLSRYGPSRILNGTSTPSTTFDRLVTQLANSYTNFCVDEKNRNDFSLRSSKKNSIPVRLLFLAKTFPLLRLLSQPLHQHNPTHKTSPLTPLQVQRPRLIRSQPKVIHAPIHSAQIGEGGAVAWRRDREAAAKFFDSRCFLYSTRIVTRMGMQGTPIHSFICFHFLMLVFSSTVSGGHSPSICLRPLLLRLSQGQEGRFLPPSSPFQRQDERISPPSHGNHQGEGISSPSFIRYYISLVILPPIYNNPKNIMRRDIKYVTM